MVSLIQQPFTGESEAYEGHVSMVDLLLAAGAAPDAGADVGGAKGFVGSVGLGGGGVQKWRAGDQDVEKIDLHPTISWGLGITGVEWGCNGIEENIQFKLIQYKFTSTFPMILYNQNISKWDVFGI